MQRFARLLSLLVLATAAHAATYTWAPNGNTSGGNANWDNTSPLWHDGSSTVAIASFTESTTLNLNGNSTLSKIDNTPFAGSTVSGTNLTQIFNLAANSNVTITANPGNANPSITVGNAIFQINIPTTAKLNLGGSTNILTITRGYNVSTGEGLGLRGGGTVNLNNNVRLFANSNNSRLQLYNGTTLNANTGSLFIGKIDTLDGEDGEDDSSTNIVPADASRIQIFTGTLNLNGGTVHTGYAGTNTTGYAVARHFGVLIGVDSTGTSAVNINSGTLTAIGDPRGTNATYTAGILFANGTQSGGTLNLNGGTLVTSSIAANPASKLSVVNLNNGTLAATTELTPYSGNSSICPTPEQIQYRADNFIAGFKNDATSYVSINGNITLDTTLATVPLSIQSVLRGNGNLTKTGASTLRILANNTHTGTITLANGEINLGPSAVLPGPVNVAPAATLSGSGRTTTVNLQPGAQLAPEKNYNNTGTITLADDAQILLDLAAITTSDTTPFFTTANLTKPTASTINIKVKNPDPALTNYPLLRITSNPAALSASSFQITGIPGWKLSYISGTLSLVNSLGTRPTWNSTGNTSASTAANWANSILPENDTRLILASNTTLHLDQTRAYAFETLEINSAIAGSITAIPTASLTIGTGGIILNGSSLNLGNTTFITNSVQTWKLNNGTLTLGANLQVNDLLTIDAGNSTINLSANLTQNWIGQVNITGTPTINLTNGTTLTTAQLARITINNYPAKISGTTLVADTSTPVNPLAPLLHYTFDEQNNNSYTSTGSIRAQLQALGANQTQGSTGSGPTGDSTDRAWDASQNPSQDTLNTSRLQQTGSIPALTNGNFTITLWYNSAQPITNSKYLYHNGDSTNLTKGIALKLAGVPTSGYNFQLQVGNGTTTNILGNTFILDYGIGKTNQWIFAALTFTANTTSTTTNFYYATKVYPVTLAGTSTADANLTPSPSGEALIIGNSPDLKNGFAGKIDNLRVYSSALTLAQLDAIRATEAGPYISEGKPARPLAENATQIYNSDLSATQNLYAPSLLKTGNSTLIAALTIAAPGNKTSGGSTRTFTTNDGGSTWSPSTQTIPLSHARLFQTGGKLWLIGTSTNHDIALSNSTDGGSTWSAPIALNTGKTWLPSTGNVRNENGTLTLAIDQRVTRFTADNSYSSPDIAPIVLTTDSTNPTQLSDWRFSSEKSFKDIIPGFTPETAAQEFMGIPFDNNPPPADIPFFEKQTRLPMGWRDAQVFRIKDINHYWFDGNSTHFIARAFVGTDTFATLAKATTENGTLTTNLVTAPSGKNQFFIPFPGGGEKPFVILEDSANKGSWLITNQPSAATDLDTLSLYYSSNFYDWIFAGIVSQSDPQAEAQFTAITDGTSIYVLKILSSLSTQTLSFEKIENIPNLIY